MEVRAESHQVSFSSCFALVLIEETSLVVVLGRQTGCKNVDVITNEEETGAEKVHSHASRRSVTVTVNVDFGKAQLSTLRITSNLCFFCIINALRHKYNQK